MIDPDVVAKATLALDELLIRPELAGAAAELARLAPTWLHDQIGAATADTRQTIDTMMTTGAYSGRVMVRPDDVPDWVRLGALTALAQWVGARGSTCLHAPHPDRPEPLLAAAWKPDLMVCAGCSHLLTLPRGSDADRRCDGCGRVTAGTAADPMWPSGVQVGPMHFAFASCTTCRASLPGAPMAAATERPR